ncbi:MAG: 2-dehydro-3-deoxygalactonokinase [Verrucomicrobiales bacterium]|nr:2-dehydro-3-deoxygalactonokinase [Verrucomicrobiales bacterium]
MSTDPIAWIAADWGTSNLRCCAMSADHRVVDRAESGRGMQAISTGGGDFEAALLELIQRWLRPGETIPISACGMVGAKQGWIEVPYVTAPCSPGTPTHRAPTRSAQISVSIHAGVRQNDPADVMRGEETQIAGLLALQPGFEGLVGLPGTHTKWATLADGKIQSFQTFMTGEAFALLSQHSVLRLTLAPESWDETAFLEGIHRSLASPADLLSHAFRLRAESLLNGLDGTAARSRLSGLLIGQELAAVRPSGHVSLIGAGALTRPYQTALEALGIKATLVDSEAATIAGLAVAHLSSDGG